MHLLENNGTLSKVAALLNTLLAPAGLEIRTRARTLAELQTLPRLHSAGRILELVGTQGIGKSTLCNDVQKRLKDRWFFRSDLEQVGPAPTPATDLEDIHGTLYFQRIQWLEQNKNDAWDGITRSRQAARVISESLTLMTNDFPRGFVLDEGLFKNFPREILKHAEPSSNMLWNDRALIHLRARDAGSVVARYVNRMVGRQRRGLLQRVPSEAEILARVEEDNTLFDQMLQIAQSRGCATLQINAEDPHEENIARILDFEHSRFAIPGSAS